MIPLKNVPELPDTTEHSRSDLSRDLAALHEICVAHSDELRTLSNERGAQQVGFCQPLLTVPFLYVYAQYQHKILWELINSWISLTLLIILKF